MRVLLDSHTLLWAVYSPPKLSLKVRALLQDPSTEITISHVSFWELLSKIGRGKIALVSSSLREAKQKFMSVTDDLLPVTLDHISLAAELPHHHHDPFDRVLIAQAITEEMTLITMDQIVRKYDVKTIWS